MHHHTYSNSRTMRVGCKSLLVQTCAKCPKEKVKIVEQHHWTDWQSTGRSVTRVAGFDVEDMLGKTLHRRQCKVCGIGDSRFA